jgi:hypothetical protein
MCQRKHRSTDKWSQLAGIKPRAVVMPQHCWCSALDRCATREGPTQCISIVVLCSIPLYMSWDSQWAMHFISRVLLCSSEITNSYIYMLMECGNLDLNTWLRNRKTVNPLERKFYWKNMLEAVQTIHKHGYYLSIYLSSSVTIVFYVPHTQTLHSIRIFFSFFSNFFCV